MRRTAPAPGDQTKVLSLLDLMHEAFHACEVASCLGQVRMQRGEGGCWSVRMTSQGKQDAVISQTCGDFLSEKSGGGLAQNPISGFNNSPSDNQPHEKGAGRQICQGAGRLLLGMRVFLVSF